MYEDDEVRIPIPSEWTISTGNHPAIGAYDGAGSSVESATGKLLLANEDFTLAIAYRTSHASGVEGGRFIEMLRIPWLAADDAESCSSVLDRVPQPAGRHRIFMNLVLRTSSDEVRRKCGVSKDPVQRIEKNGDASYVAESRWFGGYFTSNGGYFFYSDGQGCGSKTYSLTSNAQSPEELPDPRDVKLKRIVAEAIDIVDSIHYKKCPPASRDN